jgi:propionyl-CoA synthetase
VLFEGKPIGTPDSSAVWRIVQDYKVTSLFTAPSKQSSEVQGHEAET